MKKHIFGFALFSLITVSTVFVSAMLYKKAKNESVTSQKEYVYEVSRNSCWKQRKHNQQTNPAAVKITQAVFNSDTKMLDISFSSPYLQEVEVYAVNEKKGFVQRTIFSLNPDSDNQVTQSMELPNNWINDLKSSDNMYVMIKTSYIRDDVSVPFEADAVPVLIISKK